MGRELRKVPVNWEHPTDADGDFIPLHGRDYQSEAADWDEGHAQWKRGFVKDWANSGWKPRCADDGKRYTDWDGARPSPDDYMPSWPEAERTHFMMYETTTEGTPLSPAFATAEELAGWLANTGASSFGSMTATYDQWLATINRGFAVSAVVVGGRMMSGVEGLAEPQKEAE